MSTLEYFKSHIVHISYLVKRDRSCKDVYALRKEFSVFIKCFVQLVAHTSEDFQCYGKPEIFILKSTSRSHWQCSLALLTARSSPPTLFPLVSIRLVIFPPHCQQFFLQSLFLFQLPHFPPKIALGSFLSLPNLNFTSIIQPVLIFVASCAISSDYAPLISPALVPFSRAPVSFLSPSKHHYQRNCYPVILNISKMKLLNILNVYFLCI